MIQSMALLMPVRPVQGSPGVQSSTAGMPRDSPKRLELWGTGTLFHPLCFILVSLLGRVCFPPQNSLALVSLLSADQSKFGLLKLMG